jgi:uncharacterized protein with HEPN domain
VKSGRGDRLLLQDILEAIAEVHQYLPADRAAFDASAPLRSHVYRHVMIVGEAAGRLSKQLKSRNPQVPWPRIEGMRHVLVHDYFKVDWNILYNTARVDIPLLRPPNRIHPRVASCAIVRRTARFQVPAAARAAHHLPMPPPISIVVPNLNGAATLEATLLSLIHQNYPNLEILVVDGGSTDARVDIIRRYEPRLARTDQILSVFQTRATSKTTVAQKKRIPERIAIDTRDSRERIPLVFWHRYFRFPVECLRQRHRASKPIAFVTRCYTAAFSRFFGIFYGQDRAKAMNWEFMLRPPA